MAGAGYKLFNTGDVLTAAQVNTYLQEQTVMVFASSAARTTALTGVLAEGMISYLTDTDLVQYYNGTAWTTINTDQTPLTTKGDLFTFSTSDARLAVGSNGETLVADSSASTGLRWQGSYPAGKNLLINGLLDIWQRSTSVTGQANGYATADRWYLVSSASCTFAQESTVVPSGCRYSQKVTVGASASSTQAYQAIETSNAVAYAGKTITFSGRFQSSATPDVSLVVEYSTDVDKGLATGGWVGITASSTSGTAAGSSSFNTISGVYAIPSTAKSLRFSFNTSSMASGSILYYGGFQAELGSVVTPLTRNAATLAGELAACQRYFQIIADGTGQSISMLAAYNSTNAYGVYPSKVTMRTTPTIYQVSGTNYFLILGNNLDNDVFDSVTALENASPNAVRFSITSGISMTQGYSYWFQSNNASARLGLQAEL